MGIAAVRTVIGTVVAILAPALDPSTALAQSFTALGVLPSGTSSQANGVSAGGAVAGYSQTPLGQRAFRWTSAGGMVDLGLPPGSASQSYAFGISADGTTVVGFGIAPPPTFTSTAFRWTAAGGMMSLQGLAGGSNVYAGAVNADGSVIAGDTDSTGGHQAFRWTSAEGMVGIGTLSGASYAYGYGISADGSVIVGESDPGTFAHAYRWTSAGGMVDLGVPPGRTTSSAAGVSADGLTVVGALDPFGTAPLAFKWTSAGGIVGLPLPAGATSSAAAGVSASGSVIVGSGTVGGAAHAFLWSPTLGAVDLNTYLPTLGLNLSGWVLNYANAVSPNGNTVVGYGRHNTRNEAWVVTVGAPACPADFNHVNGVTVQDIFDFLAAWFAGQASADFNHVGGVTVQDIFDFLAAWFAGCP